jgi:collagenase-like PrtC family protease
MTPRLDITLGPVLFHWSNSRLLDFYGRIADEAEIDRVYLGEVVCGKRSPLNADTLDAAAERLTRAGKTVVRAGLSLPITARDRVLVRGVGAGDLIEVNDMATLAGLGGRRFVAGPLLNVYNALAAAELCSLGCERLCANIELSLEAVAAIAASVPGLEIELFAFGRAPLALSGRCHHARLRGATKDSCRFACEEAPDGVPVLTVDGAPFLALNGVQTLSHAVHVADASPRRLRQAGVSALRLSPHDLDMVAVASLFRRFADGDLDDTELRAGLTALSLPGPIANGYLAAAPGHSQVALP